MLYRLSFKKIFEVYREDDTWRLIKDGVRFINGLLLYVFNKIILRKKVAVKNIMGHKMVIPLNDHGISKELFIRGIHEKISTGELQHKLQEGMQVLDIGSNIGYYALMEAKNVGRRGIVFAIEPNPQNFQLLKENVKINAYENRIRCHEIAIGNSVGTATMYISPYSNRHSLVEKSVKECIGRIQVPITTVDQFIKDSEIDPRRLGLIRMDVEGGEAEVLDGMHSILSNTQNLLMFIEWHPLILRNNPGKSLHECLEMLEKFGAVFDLLLITDEKGKVLIRNKTIREVINSNQLMNRFMESWLSINKPK